jgi:agmatinase
VRTATVIGIPYDAKSSYARGPASGPDAIRTALTSKAGNAFDESLADVLNDQTLRHAEDVPVSGDAYPLDAIDRSLSDVLRNGSVPIVLGGDHSVTYAVVRAIARRAVPFSILHLDAHNDLYDEFEGDRFSHACPFARIMEERLVARLVQVGIRCATPHQRDQAGRFNVEVIDMIAWTNGARPEMDGPCYLSIDLDVLDPAFAPGVSHREPGGLSTRELLSVVQRVSGPVIGADIVELNPTRDIDGITAGVAARVLKELIGVIGRH